MLHTRPDDAKPLGCTWRLLRNEGFPLQKIIWVCWLQGRASAPLLVRRCIDSWETCNPDWQVRCVDQTTIKRYVDLDSHIDLSKQTLTAASLSDIIRLLLLHEYGGVWVDATCFCIAPLSEWLPLAAATGFFAFARPAEDRELSTWFIAAHPGSLLLAKWTARAIAYWRERAATDDYFWVHHQFDQLCREDADARRLWQAVPRISADGPHAIQHIGLYKDWNETKDAIDWTTPLFKLTHRLNKEWLKPDCLICRLLRFSPQDVDIKPTVEFQPPATATTTTVASLKIATENLGDHIQVLAGDEMLRRAGFQPSFRIDRDDEIAHGPVSDPKSNIGVLMNGWFKTNPAEWPPHCSFKPIYLGFHIRLFQAPTLVGRAALEHYSSNAPIGCRDRHTLSLLQAHGIDAFLSHCLSLTFARRIHDPKTQDQIFVVSRDRRILQYLPDDFPSHTFLSHYSGDRDFERNKSRAADMLALYRTRARLIVTTLLHCALPALAMGIPVIIFLPDNDGAAHESDRERFSSLAELVRVFNVAEASSVDWTAGYTADPSAIKLRLIDTFFAMASAHWGSVDTPHVSGYADASALPPP